MKSISKTILSIVMAFVMFFTFTLQVNAESIINTSFEKEGNGIVGDTITLNLMVNSSDDKIYSLGGYIDFDNNYLEYISMESASSLSIMTNDSIYKFALIDFTMENGIESGIIAKINFKVLNEGTTSVSIKDVSSTDNNKYLTVNTETINLDLIKKEEEKIEIKEEIKETTKVKKEVKEVIKEKKVTETVDNETVEEVNIDNSIIKLAETLKSFIPTDIVSSVSNYIKNINNTKIKKIKVLNLLNIKIK